MNEKETMIIVKKKTASQIKQTPSAEFGDSYDTIIQKLIEKDTKKEKKKK